VVNGTAIVNGGPTEAFDLQTGEKLWENEVTLNNQHFHHVLVDGNYIFMASDLKGFIGRVEESRVWKFHARSGETMWLNRIERGGYTALSKVDNRIVLTGSGRMFAGDGNGVKVLDADSGRELWSTPELNSSGLLGGGYDVPPAMHSNGVLYFGDTENIYAHRLDDGELIFQQSHSEHGLGSLYGIEMRGNKLYAVGERAVLTLNRANGAVMTVDSTARIDRYERQGDMLVLSRGRGVTQLYHLESETPSPVVRHGDDRTFFGTFEHAAYVTEEGNAKLSINSNGQLVRYSFQ